MSSSISLAKVLVASLVSLNCFKIALLCATLFLYLAKISCKSELPFATSSALSKKDLLPSIPSQNSSEKAMFTFIKKNSLASSSSVILASSSSKDVARPLFKVSPFAFKSSINFWSICCISKANLASSVASGRNEYFIPETSILPLTFGSNPTFKLPSLLNRDFIPLLLRFK